MYECASTAGGRGGIRRAGPGAVRFEVYGGELLAARLEDIIKSKEAAGRPQDRQDVVVMRGMLRRGKAR